MTDFGQAFERLDEVLRPFGMADARTALPYSAVPVKNGPVWVDQKAPRVEMGGFITDRSYYAPGHLADAGHIVHECVVHLEVFRP